MKIAVFTDSFLPGSGGTEHAVYGVCKGFVELGHEVIIFAPDYHRSQNVKDLKVYRVKSIKATHNDMIVLAGCEIRRILKIVRGFTPDIVYYCSASGMAKCALKVAGKLGLPVAATIHTKFREAFYDSIHSKLIMKILIKNLVSKLSRTDLVTTVSYDMKEDLFEYGYKGEVQVIKNGVPHACTPSDNAAGKIDGTVNFIFCGRLTKVKNVQFTLKCLRVLKREIGFSDFKFILVGNGGYEKNLRKLVRKEGLCENVEFAGFVGDRKELYAQYKRAHLLLFPSTFDNDSLVILEAADNGVPALTLKGCGSSERITDGVNGFVAEYDVKKYAEKIYKIITDEELYIKVRGNVHTVIAKSWTETATEYINSFEKVISEYNGR